jgi:histidine kinase
MKISRLGMKLFISYFLIILISMGAVWIATRFTTPTAYQRHLSFMEQNLEMGNSAGAGQGNGNGAGMGQGNGLGRQGQGNGMMSQFYQDYQNSFNEALLIAVIAASIVALAVSVLFSRSMVSPIRSMTKASGRIAEGRYDERVELNGNDELSQLATSFNQMARQLEQVENMRRQLIGDVAHELRTPLTFIKGSAEGLMDGVLPASDETYQQIHNEAERLSHLVDDLQELSRVESRAAQLDIRAVDSAAVVGTVARRLQHQFDAKRVTLVTNLSSVPVSFLADEGRAIQILTNLVGNALQHTPEDGTVTVSVMQDRSEVRISVRDTGEGIEADHLARIFDRFYRVDKSRSRARGGSGIGLTIARHLVEAQGGRIWAESEGKQKGSVFTFTLPLVK